MSSKRRRYQERAEEERQMGLDFDGASAQWLQEHDPNHRRPNPAPRAHAEKKPARKKAQHRRRPALQPRPLLLRHTIPGNCATDGHAEATIAHEGGGLSHFYCLRCRARRES